MKKALQSIVLYLLTILPCSGLQTESADFYLEQFSDERGLPQSSITGMSFDNTGFIWIATQGGLVRFDGQKMLSFDKNRLGIASDRFIGLKRDALSGSLYAVNEHGQMVAIRNGEAVLDHRFESVQAMELAAVVRSSPNKVGKTLKIDLSKTELGYSKYWILSGWQRQYYLYTDQMVYFFDAGTLTGSLPFPGEPCYDPFPGEPNKRTAFIRQHGRQTCVDNFMSIGSALFYHLNGEGTHFLRVSLHGAHPVSLRGDIERNPLFTTENVNIKIITNRFKRQVFANLEGSIYHVTYDESANTLDTKLLITGFDIDKKLVSRMLYDEGNQVLFLGSVSMGLHVARPKMFHTVTNRFQKDFHNIYYAHLPYSQNSVVIPDGFVLGDQKYAQTRVEAFRTGAPTQREGMLKDRSGHFWIVKHHRLYQLTSDGERKISEWQFKQDPMRIYQGLTGEIWIGFDNGKVAFLKPGAKSTDKPSFVVALEGACSFLHQERPGQIWVGTTRGLFLYDHIKRRIYPVKGLAQKQVRSIYQSGDGSLWVTTYGDGIFLLSHNRLIKMPLDRNGFLAYAHCILEDSAQNFWIPSNKGLFQASKSDLIAYANSKSRLVFYRYFGKEDGFLTNEFNGGCQPCGVKLADGNFSFPSMSGLVWFKPAQIRPPDLGTPIRFENLSVDDQPQKAVDTLHLPYDFKHVSLDLASPFSGRSDNLDFRYTIRTENDKNKGWSRLDKDQKLNIYSVSPGTYTLFVRKISGFGNKSVDRKMVLIVQRPWFLSWWFVLLAMAGLGAIFFILVRWRLASLRRQNDLLTRKVEERTVNLSKALEDLRASDEALQTQLQIQMRIIGVINHDVHNPLRYLTKHVPEFIKQVDPCLSNRDTARLGNAISKSTQKVYALVDELLKFIKSTYNKKGQVIYESVAVRDLLEKKVAFFSEIAGENQSRILVEPGPPALLNTNRVMLEILIHNLLDNAVKHTFGSTIVVSAEESGHNKLIISVKDTGLGIYPEVIVWLNGGHARDRDRPNGEIPANIGLGLVMVKEIATLLNTAIEARSDSGGTIIRLFFNQ